MGDRDAFVGHFGHFGGGTGIIVGEADETFDGCDCVAVVGEGCGGGVFAEGAGGVVAYQCAVYSVGELVEMNRIDARE